MPYPDAAAGSLHRFLFGDLWRDVWTVPVHAPAVGPMEAIGGSTPASRWFIPLRRPLDVRFDPAFRALYAPGVIEDLTAMMLPYAPLVAAPLLDAAGVNHPTYRFAVTPTWSTEGPPTGSVAGFEASLDPADRIDSFELLRRLERGNEGRVDLPAYIAARIMGLYLGDWEEGSGAWQWVRHGRGPAAAYTPVLLDPSSAFTRFDGLIPWAGTFFVPSVTSWGGGRGPVERVLWSGRHLDRWLLSSLEHQEWDSVTAVTASRLSDSVIALSVNALPEPVRTRIGDDLIATLRSRRDHLREMVADYYADCARVVDIHGTDGPDAAEVTRIGDGRVRVRLIARLPAVSGGQETLLCDRTFLPSETDEVRLLLNGGDDHVLLRGHACTSIPVRVVCGRGDDVVIDSSHVDARLLGFIPCASAAEAETYVYASPRTAVLPGDGTVVRPEETEASTSDTVRFAPVREDRGHAQTWTGMFDWNSEYGPMIGLGPTITWFDFDNRPFRTQMSMMAGIAPFAGVGRVVVRAEWRGIVRRAALLLDGSASGFDVLTYFGHGNETVPVLHPDDPYYRVRQTQVRLGPAIRWPADGPFSATVRGEFRVIVTRKGEHKFVTDERPYGIGDMALATVGGGLRWDTRDDDVHPFSGMYVDVSGFFVPKAFSVGATYGRLRGDARFFATTEVPVPVTLSLRMLATRTWGKVPYFDAATIGSSTALRGYQQGRFTGASSVVGVAEARVRLGRMDIITPVMFGVLGFAETGRVYEPGENSQVWHPSFGGGVWAAPWRRDATLTASIGISKESVMLYGAVGFGF